MRYLSILPVVLTLMLSSCGVASGVEAAGRYRANWEPAEELVLNQDGRFEHLHADGTVSYGAWVLISDGVDTRVHMRTDDEQGSSVPTITRSLSGEIYITMNADERRFFVKLD